MPVLDDEAPHQIAQQTRNEEDEPGPAATSRVPNDVVGGIHEAASVFLPELERKRARQHSVEPQRRLLEAHDVGSVFSERPFARAARNNVSSRRISEAITRRPSGVSR